MVYKTHGMTKTKIYAVWFSMCARCRNPNLKPYHNYGGRGIKVCDAWLEFEGFLADMGIPEAGMTLERKDNDGNYCKENCVWADMLTQGRNRRNNRRITIEGITKPLSEWCEIYGMNRATVWTRIRRGWPDSEAISTPLKFIK